MNNYHVLQLSDSQAFGGKLRFLTCSICNRKMSVEVHENGYLLFGTLKVIDQGDFYAHHQFWFGFSDFKVVATPNEGVSG